MKNVKTRIYSIFGVEFKSMKNKNATLLRYSCDTNVTSGRCLNEISEGTNMRCTHEKGDMTKNANVRLVGNIRILSTYMLSLRIRIQ